ncbi:MAG: TonB family protein [Colwellia sp.]|nr:TonB family protein [Colwellia sp.]
MIFINSKLKLKCIAISAAALIITLLMLALLFFQKIGVTKAEQTVIRQISIASSPPPPPPPPVQEAHVDSTPTINLSANGAGPTMQFIKVKLANHMDFADIPPPEITNMTSHLLDHLSVDWQAFGLDDLDDVPRLLSNLRIKYPQNLARKGINSISIELDVLIDESGKVILRKIVHNPYPEFESIIIKLMKKARFTTPTKNGVSVRASFNWPMEFSNS